MDTPRPNLMHAALMHHALPVAKHEVGHWTMAERTGFRGRSINITLTDFQGGHRGHSEITLATDLKELQEVDAYLGLRIQVLFAGAIAETLDHQGQVDQARACHILEHDSGVHDFAKVRELLQILRSIRFSPPETEAQYLEQVRSIQNEIWIKAVTAVEADWEVITGLAESIASRAKSIGQPFGMHENELYSLPAIVKWKGQLRAANAAAIIPEEPSSVGSLP